MNSEQLSPRLDQVAQYVKDYATRPIRLADIGSDHAYLPCNLALNHLLDYAIAGEVVKGPYDSAVREVTQRALGHLIDVRFGDGLDVVKVEDKINTVTICGMGGSLITTILDAGFKKISPGTVLILQPNLAEAQLREWLVKHHYQIKMETIVEDNHRLYEIIVAQHNPHLQQVLSKKQRMFGPINLRTRSDLFQQKWNTELNKTKHLLEEMQMALQDDSHAKIVEFKDMIRSIEEELSYGKASN